MTARRRSLELFLLLCAPPALTSIARAMTTVHTYTYNIDGALTSVTIQVDTDAPSTTYLTWDDFTPDATTPVNGTCQTHAYAVLKDLGFR